MDCIALGKQGISLGLSIVLVFTAGPGVSSSLAYQSTEPSTASASDGKMTGGFAYIAYPAKYGDTGIKTFMINQDGMVFEKDLGKDTVDVATTMAAFNPDNTWYPLK